MQGACPCRGISTLEVIAKNRAPHSTTGIPPALAMAGRCGILPGYSHIASDRDAEIADSAMRVQNNMRSIKNARNLAIRAESTYATRTTLSRKATGRFMGHFRRRIRQNRHRQITDRGISGIICDRRQFGFRKRMGSFKWPKCKSLLIRDRSIDRCDTAEVAPGKSNTESGPTSGASVTRL